MIIHHILCLPFIDYATTIQSQFQLLGNIHPWLSTEHFVYFCLIQKPSEIFIYTLQNLNILSRLQVTSAIKLKYIEGYIRKYRGTLAGAN